MFRSLTRVFFSIELFKTPPLCFATQNIVEVARSDGGVNPYSKKTYEIFSTPLLRNYRFISSPLISY